MPRPARIIAHAPTNRDQIRRTITQSLIRLCRFIDQPNRNGRNAGIFANAPRHRHLIARAKVNLLIRAAAAGRRADKITAKLLQFLRENDAIGQGPTAFDPIRCGNPHTKGLFLRPNRAHGGEDL